jgi:hypothetical protein
MKTKKKLLNSMNHTRAPDGLLEKNKDNKENTKNLPSRDKIAFASKCRLDLNWRIFTSCIICNNEVICMSKTKEKVESAAEKTGEAIGAGVKKSAKAVNDFGKGIKRGIKKEE